MIEVQGITVRFGTKVILDRANLRVEDNETLVIMGLSGVGKSTILRVLMGLLKPSEGKVLIDGEDVTDYSEKQWNKVRAKMGMVFQYSALFDSMNVAENVSFGLRRYGETDERKIRLRVAEVLAQVGMSGKEEEMPNNLSGGMKKRVGLARAIATSPRIMLYDEPTAGLDPIHAAAVNNLIIKAQENYHTTSIVVTHELDSALAVADRMAFLHDGKFILDAPKEEFLQTDIPLIKQFLQGRGKLPQGGNRHEVVD